MGIGIYIMSNEMMRLRGIYEIDTSMCVQTLFSLINFVENEGVTFYTFSIANVPCVTFVNARKEGYGCGKGIIKLGWGTVEYNTSIHVRYRAR